MNNFARVGIIVGIFIGIRFNIFLLWVYVFVASHGKRTKKTTGLKNKTSVPRYCSSLNTFMWTKRLRNLLTDATKKYSFPPKEFDP